MHKHPIDPRRVRRVPGQFSWVDHRLVRNRYFERFSHSSGTLYLFLVTVSDAQGLSYYSEATLLKLLRMDITTLRSSREELVRLELILWRKPIYQVLPLELASGADKPFSRSGAGGPVSLRRILQSFSGEEA